MWLDLSDLFIGIVVRSLIFRGLLCCLLFFKSVAITSLLLAFSERKFPLLTDKVGDIVLFWFRDYRNTGTFSFCIFLRFTFSRLPIFKKLLTLD